LQYEVLFDIAVPTTPLKIFELFLASIFCVFLDRFDVLMSKVNFKNKKYYFDSFLSEKHFEKQPLPHLYIGPKYFPPTLLLVFLNNAFYIEMQTFM
jgi:hypothetical protein